MRNPKAFLVYNSIILLFLCPVLLTPGHLLIPVLICIMQPALLVTSTPVTVITFYPLTPEKVIKIVRKKVKLRVKFSQRGLSWKRWRDCFLPYTCIVRTNQLCEVYFEKPAQDFVHYKGAKNVFAHSGRQVKPVRNGNMFYNYYFLHL